MDEVLYSARYNRHGSIELAKFDGHTQPLEKYTITHAGRGKCDCLGSLRTPYCKHKQLLEEWLALGPIEGGFYNYDAKILYTPVDNQGEGIPLGPYWPLHSPYYPPTTQGAPP